MKIYLADNWPNTYLGNPGQLNPDLFGEWISESFFYRKRRLGRGHYLALSKAMPKLDRLVAEHDLHGNRPIGIDIEDEPIADLVAIGDAVRGAYPRLKWGFFAATKPTPPPEDARWERVAKHVGLTWSQGWLNRPSLQKWEESIGDQLQRWSVRFPTHCRAITMSPRVHPVAIHKGWYPAGWVPIDQWRKMWTTASALYDVAVVHHQGQPWRETDEWFEVMAEVDQRLKRIHTEF